MSESTQVGQILEALENGDALTSIDALNRFGCFRLGARIMELRKMGYPIATSIIGGRKHFASYTMEKEAA